MYLNTIKPGKGSKKARHPKGRGIGSGHGKTCGRGHKGQHSRSGGSIAVGFEGGQMPLQRRVPKFGFTSRKALLTAEVRLHELNKVQSEVVDLLALKLANVVPERMRRAKIILNGKIEKKLTIKGLAVTKGARAAIEAVGGCVM